MESESGAEGTVENSEGEDDFRGVVEVAEFCETA